jgi:hypothetical protein
MVEGSIHSMGQVPQGKGRALSPCPCWGDGRSLDTRSPDGMRQKAKILECVTTVRREMSAGRGADNRDTGAHANEMVILHGPAGRR